MANGGCSAMLSLADLYFYSSYREDGEMVNSYRFQWSTDAVTTAVNNVVAPNLNDYLDYEDGEYEIDSEYWAALAHYDYISNNKNDGTDNATSFIFRIYDKATGELVKEIQTSEKSVELPLDDGDYLWDVTALQGNTVLKTSEKRYMTTNLSSLGGVLYYNENENDSSKQHSIAHNGPSAEISLAKIESDGGSVKNGFFVCREVGSADIFDLDEESYNKAQQGNYTYSVSFDFEGADGEFVLSENCLFSLSGIYVYRNGKWDYLAYCTEVNTAERCEKDNLFSLDDDSCVSASAAGTIMRYNAATGKIEVVAATSYPVWDFSPDGRYYLSQYGVYSTETQALVLQQAVDCGEYLLYNDAMVNIYCMYGRNGGYTKTEDLDSGDPGSLRVTYSPLNGAQASTYTLYQSDDLDGEICSEDAFSFRAGDYMCYQIGVWNEDDQFREETVLVAHQLQNGQVINTISKSYDSDWAWFQISSDGDLEVHTSMSMTPEIWVSGVTAPNTGSALAADRYGVSWQIDWSSAMLTGNIISISRQDAPGTFSLVLDPHQEAIEFYGLGKGAYTVSRQEEGSDKVASAQVLVSEDSAVKRYRAGEDYTTDLFFAKAQGVWGSGYAAEHVGNSNDYYGGGVTTGDQVSLAGKNRIADIFEGAAWDASVLLLTDDSNGDALFVDDIYTVLPDTVTEQQARVNSIKEIYAGAGDDVIDLTSQRFTCNVEYGYMTVYGGSGNDTIWGGNDSYYLYGDAGNDHIIGGSYDDKIIGGSGDDYMHGGGGWDSFYFGGNWGNDIVEQSGEYGHVELYFETGSMDNWNAETMTYTDGVNSVKVIGCDEWSVSLSFGMYDEWSTPAGAYDDFVTDKIYEDKKGGMLA